MYYTRHFNYIYITTYMFIIPVPSMCCSEFDSTPLELIIWWHKCCSFLPQETFSEKIKLESSKFCAKCHSNRSSCCSQIIPKTVLLTKKRRKEKWRIDFLFPPRKLMSGTNWWVGSQKVTKVSYWITKLLCLCRSLCGFLRLSGDVAGQAGVFLSRC